MKAVVFTLGCKVNECESDSLINGLIKLGYEVSDKLEYADLYIVNTCAVTAEAEKKSRQTSSRIYKLNPNARVIFTGCATQKNPKPFTEKKNASLVTGVFGKNKILEMLNDCGEKIFDPTSEFEELLAVKSLRTRAYVKVQDGCNNFCAYCIIPYLRGRSRSRDTKNVVEEVVTVGAKETVINGINLSAYDYNGKTLTDLMLALKDVNTRIRLGSLEVGVITEEFLTALKGLKDFAPHFHLSLQSGSNAVLKKMNRHYTTEEFKDKVDLIRKFFPLAGITTDIIVGFPTETEEDFLESVNFAKEVAFSDIHPFIFSPRSGTVAYKMVDLPHEIKKARLDKLLQVKLQLKEKFISSCINKPFEIIVEESADGFMQGYTENYIRAYIKGEYAQGEKVKAILTESYKDGGIFTPIK